MQKERCTSTRVYKKWPWCTLGLFAHVVELSGHVRRALRLQKDAAHGKPFEGGMGAGMVRANERADLTQSEVAELREDKAPGRQPFPPLKLSSTVSLMRCSTSVLPRAAVVRAGMD